MQYLEDIRRFIEILVKSQKFHLLTIMGSPGWAKTHTTRKVLSELGVDFECLGSYSTPLGLYNHLCNNRDKILVIDDTAGIFHNPQAMSILNAASWSGAEKDGARVIRWTSSSELAAAPSVEFKGKIIVLTNFVPETSQGKAFVNRSLHYHIQLDGDLIAELLMNATESKEHYENTELAQKVARFLSENIKFCDVNRFSLRTLEMGYEFATISPDNWQDMLLKTLPKISSEEVVRELEGTSLTAEDQCRQFRAITGKSRRTFFYVRERLGLKQKKNYGAESISDSQGQ